MSCYITITNADNTNAWAVLGDSQDRKKIDNLLETDRRTCNLVEALFMPIRTNTSGNFAKDLFLPTTLHYAVRIENVALRVLALIPAFALDVATLVFRLITCIPRAIYNSYQEEHPLHSYLAEQGADPKILDSDCIRVRGIYIVGVTSLTGQILSSHQYNFAKTVNLIEARYYEFSNENDRDNEPMSNYSASNIRSQLENLGLPITDEIIAHLEPRTPITSIPIDREIEELP